MDIKNEIKKKRKGRPNVLDPVRTVGVSINKETDSKLLSMGSSRGQAIRNMVKMYEVLWDSGRIGLEDVEKYLKW